MPRTKQSVILTAGERRSKIAALKRNISAIDKELKRVQREVIKPAEKDRNKLITELNALSTEDSPAQAAA